MVMGIRKPLRLIAALVLIALLIAIVYTQQKASYLPLARATNDRAIMMPAPLHARSPIMSGPLRKSTQNPRYFSDASGKIVYLTGAHTWSNFQDNGGSDPPPTFDYTAYLDFLEANNHNFFRLWSWEQASRSVETSDTNYRFSPMPYQRTGSGNALDGKPKFDLTKWNQAYFDRLRTRVLAARERGMYVSIVLFNGWSVSSNKGSFGLGNPWQGHPFNKANNINSINGDANNDNSGDEVHRLDLPAVTAIQEAYVRKVIDTVNDLDNVLYEISNESGNDATEWQYHMITMIKDYEATKPMKHPVGMTVEYPDGNNAELLASPADWVSLNGDVNNPPVADGTKVILADTDHLCGICGDRSWVWKSFAMGENPIFMDGYDGAGYGVGGSGFDFNDPTWVSLRRSLGYTLAYADRMNLAAIRPRPDLASSGYCLANAAASGAEYLVYLPTGGSVNVNVTATTGQLNVEWFNPATGTTASGGSVTGGATRSFQAPFSGDAVLFVYQQTNPTVTPTASATTTPTNSATNTRTATATATLTVTSTKSTTATPINASTATKPRASATPSQTVAATETSSAEVDTTALPSTTLLPTPATANPTLTTLPTSPTITTPIPFVSATPIATTELPTIPVASITAATTTGTINNPPPTGLGRRLFLPTISK